jgi:RimJ/RimL family protein N-acetyltransferase
LLASEIFPEASESELEARSLVSFYRWMKSTFQVIYIIEVEEIAGRRIIGFAGLYDLKMGKSLWLSLTIPDPKDRRRGYGTKTLELVLDLLIRNGAVQTVYAEVLETNITSLYFLRKVGFEVSRRYENSFILEKMIGKI